MKKKIGLIVSLALVIVFYALAVTMPATELLTPAGVLVVLIAIWAIAQSWRRNAPPT